MDCGCSGKGYGAHLTIEPTLTLRVALLSRGIIHPDVVILRKKLSENVAKGFLKSLTSQEFDSDLQYVLVGFQQAKGLQQTGVAEKPTWAKLLGVSEDAIAIYDPSVEDAPPASTKTSGTSPLLWVAAAAAAWFALS